MDLIPLQTTQEDSILIGTSTFDADSISLGFTIQDSNSTSEYDILSDSVQLAIEIPAFQIQEPNKREQQDNSNDSITLLFGIILCILTISFTKSRDSKFYRNQYKRLWQLPKLKNKDIRFAKPFVNQLNSVALISVSCLALKFSFGKYFGFNDDLTTGFFIILIIVLYMLNSAKLQIEKGIAGLLDIQVYQEAYHIWLNNSAYILIYPLAILSVLSINVQGGITLGIGISTICVLGIFYILKVVKQYLMVQKHPLVKILYLSLYLCTLEILPLLVGIHFLIKN